MLFCFPYYAYLFLGSLDKQVWNAVSCHYPCLVLPLLVQLPLSSALSTLISLTCVLPLLMHLNQQIFINCLGNWLILDSRFVSVISSGKIRDSKTMS